MVVLCRDEGAGGCLNNTNAVKTSEKCTGKRLKYKRLTSRSHDWLFGWL